MENKFIKESAAELLEKLGNVEKKEKKSPWEKFKNLFQ